MLLLFTIVIGMVLGAITSLFMKHVEAITGMLLGVSGALCGGFLARAIIVPLAAQAYIGFSILGALMLLAIFRLATGDE